VDTVLDALTRTLRVREVSLVIVDEPGLDVPPVRVPLLVVDGGGEAPRLIAAGDPDGTLAAEIERRLAKGAPGGGRRRAHATAGAE
jgi:hypothetical protein